MTNSRLFVVCMLVGCGGGTGGSGGGGGGGSGGTGGNTACPEPTGAGTEHSGFISADETWTAEDSPHHVTFHVDVRGAQLTIEPCAVVEIDAGYSITVGENIGDDASLIAHGDSAERRVIFRAADASTHWGSLMVVTTGTLDLEHVTLIGGGATDGALRARGDDNRLTPVRNLRAIDVRVERAATFGVAVTTSAGFTQDSANLTVTDSGDEGTVSAGLDSRHAVYIEAPAIGTLPTGSYTGNAIDAILANAPFTLEVDETFRARGVPYQIVSSFSMNPTSSASTLTLTLEAGVTLRMGGPEYTNPAIHLGSHAGNDVSAVLLVAAGTASAPIVITSGHASPAAGDWSGIHWAGGPATGNVMSHVTVEYGGGESSANGFGCGPTDNDALLLIRGWRPDDAFIQNSTFAHSPTGGIVSGWSSNATGPDFRATNTFDAIGNGCEISMPADENGICPGNDANPDCY